MCVFSAYLSRMMSCDKYKSTTQHFTLSCLGLLGSAFLVGLLWKVIDRNLDGMDVKGREDFDNFSISSSFVFAV